MEAHSRSATGTGLGAGTSGFKGQALFLGIPESPASIPSPVLARLGELASYPPLSRESPPTFHVPPTLRDHYLCLPDALHVCSG